MIATMVPRAAFSWVTARLRGVVKLPLITTNRINDPAVAEAILARGDADMVSMARPFLADADFVAKAARGEAASINTCIACNQACLDHIFERKIATCLVNPHACRETEMPLAPARARRRIAIVGAGPAGLACATTAAACGHDVTLFDAAPAIGGQFNLARRIPGKEEFAETLRYYANRLAALRVDLRLGRVAAVDDLRGFDAVILATGIVPRQPAIDGLSHPSVASYVEIVDGRRSAGSKVAIIGAGGIGFDVAEFLTHAGHDDGHASTGEADDPAIDAFRSEWGIDTSYASREGIAQASEAAPPRQVWLLQRKAAKVGDGLAKTTGVDPPDAASEAQRHDARRRHLRSHRRCGIAPARRRTTAGPRRRHHRDLRRTGAPARARGAAGGGGSRLHADRWCRCRGGARRQARDRAGDAGRAGAVMGADGGGSPSATARRLRPVASPRERALDALCETFPQLGSHRERGRGLGAVGRFRADLRRSPDRAESRREDVGPIRRIRVGLRVERSEIATRAGDPL